MEECPTPIERGTPMGIQGIVLVLAALCWAFVIDHIVGIKAGHIDWLRGSNENGFS
jgi:hypothetical protein